MMALGGAVTVAPLFLGASPVGRGLAGLIPLGLVMVVGGGLLLWLGQDSPIHGTGASESAPREVSPGARAEPTGLSRFDLDAYDHWRSCKGEDGKNPEPTPVNQRPTSWSVEVFKAIEWRRFEAVLEALFRQAGFQTKSQSHGADEGVDVWLYSSAQPEVAIGLVQCKHWHGKRVGVDKIRELRGVMAAKKVDRGLVATTSTFTEDAAAFARENGIDLLDITRLLELIAKRPPEDQKALLDVALEGDYATPTCVNCGIKMVKRVSGRDGSAFWGCKNFPGCRTTLPMRSA